MNARSGDNGTVGWIAKRSEASSFGCDLEGNGEDGEVGAFCQLTQKFARTGRETRATFGQERSDFEERHRTEREWTHAADFGSDDARLVSGQFSWLDQPPHDDVGIEQVLRDQSRYPDS